MNLLTFEIFGCTNTSKAEPRTLERRPLGTTTLAFQPAHVTLLSIHISPCPDNRRCPPPHPRQPLPRQSPSRMVNTGPRPESAQDAPARQQGGAATLGRRSTMPVSHTARSYSPISPASRTSPAVRRSATVSSLDRTDQRRGQQRVSEESSSESGSFIGLPRNPSWSGDLNRAPSDCSNDSECRVPCLPDWPELDRAAFERGANPPTQD